MIYVASPYSHEDAKVRERQAMSVVAFSAALMEAGVHVFSPIAHCHLMAANYSLPGNFEFWEAYDREYMDFCESMIVYTLPGWNTSVGVSAEVQYMRESNKSIIYVQSAHMYIKHYLPELHQQQ